MPLAAAQSLLNKFSSTADADGWPAAGATVARYARQQFIVARDQAFHGTVRLVDAALGVPTADSYFWRRRRPPTWGEVHDRVLTLHTRNPESVEHFVRASLECTNDPIVVVGLARHPIASDHVSRWLIETFEQRSETLNRRLASSRVLGAGMAGAARLLLESPQRDEIERDIEERYEIPDSRYHQFIDSLGFRLSSASGVETGRARRNCEHRLIIIERLDDAADLALLLGGASKATVLVTADTFGRADLSTVESWCGIEEIVVEHVRTRIARFSTAYIELHEATGALAGEAVDVLRRSPFELPVDLESIMTMGIADFLFFQALRIRAVEELITDDGFDHIVVATDSLAASREFLRSVRAAQGLLSDQRVDVVSIASSAVERQRFWPLIDELVEPVEPRPRSYEGVPQMLISRKVDEEARRLADVMGSPTLSGRPRVMVATSGTPAYLDSTPSYVAELTTTFDTSVMVLGGDVEPLEEAIDVTALVGFDVMVLAAGRFVPLADLLAPLLVPASEGDGSAAIAARSVLRFGAQRLVREVIGPISVRAQAVDERLKDLAGSGAGPAAIVVTPQRTVWSGLVAVAARRYGIPTIAVEPHAQDANYSRYSKILCDYYGVMSDYFRERTSLGFEIDIDRIATIGSPRQVTPASYDPDTAQRAARIAFLNQHGRSLDSETAGSVMAFFCQPSAWGHVKEVWQTILEAAEATDSVVLLKTHPEESISRIDQYLDLAASLGLSKRVVFLDTDPATAIELSDLVVTGYSTGAVDAMIRHRPVVCVANGDVAYPVDLPAMLDIPVVRSSAELTKLVESHLRSPGLLRERTLAFLARERQFSEGPGPGLRALVNRAIEAGPLGVRHVDSLPESLLLEGPHPVFTV